MFFSIVVDPKLNFFLRMECTYIMEMDEFLDLVVIGYFLVLLLTGGTNLLHGSDLKLSRPKTNLCQETTPTSISEIRLVYESSPHRTRLHTVWLLDPNI